MHLRASRIIHPTRFTVNRFLLLLVALLIAPNVLAQSYAIDKGSYLLGGTVSFSSEGGDDILYGGERVSTLTLNPSFAYFVTSGLALGADVLYSSASSGGASITSLGLGPNLAYFFGGPTSSAYPFISAGIAYTSTDVGVTLSGFGADVSGGVTFMVARNVGLTAEAFFQTSSLSADELDDSFGMNTFGLRGGVTAFIF